MNMDHSESAPKFGILKRRGAIKISEFCGICAEGREKYKNFTDDVVENCDCTEIENCKETEVHPSIKPRRKTKRVRRSNTVGTPLYTPDYVKPVEGVTQRNNAKTDNSHLEEKSCLRKQCSVPVTTTEDLNNLSLEALRLKYARKTYTAEVPVKDKVALMESWSQKSAEANSKPPQPIKRSSSNAARQQPKRSPEKKNVQFRSQTRALDNNRSTAVASNLHPRRPMRDSKHRRSMSDPNLHKSFQAMKQLWDKKVEQDSKPQLQPKKANKSRGNSESSNHSDDFDGGLKASIGRVRAGSARVSSATEGKRIGSSSPTRPKPNQLKPTDNYFDGLRTKSHSNADQDEGSLVKNRAKLFDSSTTSENKPFSMESNKSSLTRKKNRASTTADQNVSSDENNGLKGRVTVIGNAIKERVSPRHTTNNNKLVQLLDHEESIDKDNNDDFLMSSMRRNSANLAKERRRRRASKDSESDSSSAASSLSSTSVEGPVSRRPLPKEDPGPQKQANTSPVIKSFLHRNSSPKSLPSSPSFNPVKPPRRKRSSGGSFERHDSDISISSTGRVSPSNPVPPRRQSSLHKDHTSSMVSTELDISPTVALHRKLSIDAVKRASLSTTDSGTGTVSPGINRNSRSSTNSARYRDSITSESGSIARVGSFSATSGTPPAPPPSSNKPGRPRSASTSPMLGQHHHSSAVRPNVPPPPPPAAHKRTVTSHVNEPSESVKRDSMLSNNSISSTLSQISGLSDGNFNAEEEYNRILNVISSPTAMTRYRTDSSAAEDENKIKETQEPSITIENSRPSKPTDSKQYKPNANRDSLEVPSRKSGNSDNESWSDYDPSDVDEEGNQSGLKPSEENQTSCEPTPTKVPVEVKIHNIAKELLSTEVTYVDVLKLIDQIFHKRVLEAINKKQISSDVKNIFSNVSAIYQFHNGYLLPQLQERLDCWDTNPKLGDIMTQAAPFLKMYSLYVQNFDEAMNMVKHWSEKSNNFANIIKQTQAMPECGNLSLQHHMLGPVQRIPRYKMLLEDYLKRLPEDAADRPEAETALTLISQAATHSNETMKQSDKFHKLLNVYNNLIDINFDIVDVSRELIVEGKIIKISARNGEKHERYLYLFNDMLLCCTPHRRLQRKAYRVTAKIDLDGMQITDVTNMTIPNTFCVNGTKKSMEFAANTAEEKEKWVNAINNAIQSFLERKTSFMKNGIQKRKVTNAAEEPGTQDVHDIPQQQVPQSPLKSPSHRPISFEEIDTNEEKRIEITCTPGAQYVVDIEDQDLGKRAPRWIKDNEVTMCMNCSKAFNRLLRRRHHCRACGRVICTECSEHKLELQYEPGKNQKVCNKCYIILTGGNNTGGGDKKGVLEIEADIVSGHSILSEYLFFADRKKTWTKMWCVIPQNEPCLYIYGANQDVRATMTMPLPGFTVEQTQMDREFSFKLVQARKVLHFAASSKEQKQRWEYVFRKAGRGEDVTREDVWGNDQLKNDIPEETVSRFSPANGSRLSSSSAESTTMSSTSNSDSSRPSSIMEKNISFHDVNDICANDNSTYSEITT